MTTPLTTAGDQAAKAPVGLREPECASAMIDGLCVGNGHPPFHVFKHGVANKHASATCTVRKMQGSPGQSTREASRSGAPPLTCDASGSAVNVLQHKSQEN